MVKRSGALFDLDGVLVDTEGIYSVFWAEMNRLFPTGVSDLEKVIKGTTLENIYATYFPDAGTRDKISARLRELEENMPYRLFPGVEGLLSRMRERGMKIAIVTSSGKAKMNHLFDVIPCLKQYVDTLIVDQDVSRSKPDPEGYMLAAARLGLPAEDCFVFEDSIQGLKAGRAAGATVIGVATTNPREVVEPLADFVVDNTGDFISQL